MLQILEQKFIFMLRGAVKLRFYFKFINLLQNFKNSTEHYSLTCISCSITLTGLSTTLVNWDTSGIFCAKTYRWV